MKANKFKAISVAVCSLVASLCSEAQCAETVYVLSIDGGGTRGIIPAKILDSIEVHVQNRVKTLVEKDIKETLGEPLKQPMAAPSIYLAKGFDLIAGTSTGGIIALGLAKSHAENTDYPEYKPMDLFNLYKTKSKDIFPPTMQGIWSPTYSPTSLELILKQYFGDSKFEESVTNLLILSYQLEKQKYYPFTSNFQADKAVYMRDVARATSAAPTYFPAANIQTPHGPMVDGGIAANNPGWLAYKKAKKDFPNSRIVLLSLGTGEVDATSLEGLANKGIAGWFLPLLTVLMNNHSHFTHQHLQNQQKNDASFEYVRIQPVLQPGDDELDKSDDKHLEKLTNIATQHIDSPIIFKELFGFIHAFSQNYLKREVFIFSKLDTEIRQRLVFNKQEFVFENYNISDITAWEINSFLKKRKIQPRTLKFSGNEITYQGAKLLINGLNNIQYLDLSKNKINSDISLAHVLNTLVELKLDENKVGEGIKNILPFLPNLEKLSISKNNIEDDGALLIAQYLKKLTILNISENSIKFDGANKLMNIVNLKELNLSYNSADAVSGIANYLKGVGGWFGNQSSLTNLDLSYNNIADTEFEALGGALQGNTMIKSLILAEKSQNGKAPIQNRQLLVKYEKDKLLGGFAKQNLELHQSQKQQSKL